VCTSIVVACELRYGAAKRGSARLSAQLEQVLAVLPILALETDVGRHYGDIRSDLERKGAPIGANDLLIAAQARALGLILITDNVRELGRVERLEVKSWLGS
jgi:tRNA(fMet)-specific endonuclease VapC